MSGLARLGLLAVLSPTTAVAADLSRDPIDLVAFEALEDPEGEREFEEVVGAPGWRAVPGRPNEGYSRSAWWFRTTLTSDVSVDRVLEITDVYTDYLDVWLVDGAGEVQTHVALGDLRPFDERPFAVPGFVVPFSMEPGTLVLYVREQSEGVITLNARVASPTVHAEALWRRSLGRGVFYGLLLFLVVQGGLLTLVLRDRIYAAFSLYIGAFGFYHAQAAGLADAILWPGLPGLSASQVSVVCLMAFGIGSFTLEFTELEADSLLERLTRFVLFLVALDGVAALFLPYRLTAIAINVLVAVGIVACLAVGLEGWRRRRPLAAWYLAGWLPGVFGTVAHVGTNLGVIASPELRSLVSVGVLLQATLFSIALALRVRLLLEEREAAREQALAVKAKAAARLERLVEERTAQLEVAMQRVVEAAKLREQVEDMVFHDLKTPLGSVFMVPTVLGAVGPLNPAQEQILQELETAGHRMLELVNRSHDLFHIERGTYQLTPTQFDLQALLLDLLADMRRQREDVEVVLDAPFPLLPVVGEPLLAYGVLQNLVLNAVQAAPGGTRVAVAPRVAGSEIQVRITNSGEVPAQLQARFFERGATAGKKGGTGLGTYIARRLAEVQRGRVELDAGTPGRTTVTVWLPAADVGDERPRHHWASSERITQGA